MAPFFASRLRHRGRRGVNIVVVGSIAFASLGFVCTFESAFLNRTYADKQDTVLLPFSKLASFPDIFPGGIIATASSSIPFLYFHYLYVQRRALRYVVVDVVVQFGSRRLLYLHHPPAHT